MNAEVQKLINSGRLQGRYGEQLSALEAGVYCRHKSWGVGKVVSWDLLGGRIHLNFEGKPNHGMKLEFAAKSLTPIDRHHILAERLENLEGLQQLAQDDPVTLMEQVVSSHGNSMMLDQVEAVLKGTVVPDENYRTWWENAKKKLRQNRLFVVPSKRNLPLELRPSDLNIEDGLLEDFHKARELKAKVAAVEAIIKDLEQIESPAEKLRPVVEAMNEAARKSQRLQTAAAIELIASRERLQAAVPELQEGLEEPAIKDIVIENESNLHDIIGQLPAAGQRRVYEAFEGAFLKRWPDVLLGLLNVVNLRGVSDIARIAAEKGQDDALVRFLKLGIQQRSLSTDVLAWVCKERRRLAKDVFGPEMASAAINALERDHYDDETKKMSKLQDVLMSDSLLVNDLLEEASRNQVRMFARRLKSTPAIEDLNRNSLLARVIKAHPETHHMVTGEAEEEEPADEALVVSWESLEKRKEQLEDIVQKRIPENTKEIAAARAFGDLRENFEFKAAKDMQSVLIRQREDLEAEIAMARGTDFRGVDSSQVGVGTIVTIMDEQGKHETYTILGAWDTDLEKGIISYLSAAGKAMMGHQVGDEVKVVSKDSDNARKVVVEAIEPYLKN